MLSSLLLIALLQTPLSASAHQTLAPGGELHDVAYGSLPHQKFDVYYPLHTSPPYRVMLFLHGGGFTDGDKAIDPALPLFAEVLQRGIAVASANYGLAPQYKYPQPVYDAGRCVQFLRSESAQLGLDPDHVAVMGRSAGAALALWIAYAIDLDNPGSPDPVLRHSSRPSLVVNLSGTTDFGLLASYVDGDFFGKSTMGQVSKWTKDNASARQWVSKPNATVISTYSVYKGPVLGAPLADPHAALFGFALHSALNDVQAPACVLDWNPDPSSTTPDLAIAAWLDLNLR
jgi:acetyl esterase/lipase